MTEQEWLACTDPQTMLKHLSASWMLDDRKLRLLAVACCRRIWFWLEDESNLLALETQEQHADHPTSASGQGRMNRHAWTAWAGMTVTTEITGWSFVGWAVELTKRDVGTQEGVVQSSLLRCIFGNPFHLVAIDPALLTWRNATIRGLAQAAYDDRVLPSGELDHVRLAVLADALEEAGCSQTDLVDHVRYPGPHVRGCWAVDLLLSKK
jgi:hypothetical protein